MTESVEWEITDDQLANYPSYSWPLRCCWCGSGMGAQVKATDVDGITFICQLCGKPNSVHRRGNRIRVSPGSRIPLGYLIAAAIVVALLIWRYLL